MSFAFTSIYKKIAMGDSEKRSKNLKSGIVIPKCINQSDESKVKNAVCINQKEVKKNLYPKPTMQNSLWKKSTKKSKATFFYWGKETLWLAKNGREVQISLQITQILFQGKFSPLSL